MAYPLSASQKAVLLGSHRMSTTAVALRGSVRLGSLPVIDGSTTATLGTRGARDAVFTTTITAANTIGLTPLSDIVTLATNVPDAFDVTLFTGRVETIRKDERGRAVVQLMSVAREAIGNEFVVPWPSTQTIAAAEMALILEDSDPSWGVDISRATPKPLTGQQVWEANRGQALDAIASGASLVWLPDRFGGFEVFDNPYSIGPVLANTSVIMFKDGQDGAIVQVNDTSTRGGVFNAVTVVVERTDNTAPLRFTAYDSFEGSPTRWGGPFGRQNKVIKNPAANDPGALALRLLRQSLALRRSWTIRIPHCPILDPGDVFTLWHDDEVTAQVVESTQYGLSGRDGTVITSRELVVSEGALR